MAGIYIHIPFCKSFCNYCDFYSITDDSLKGDFVRALIREASLRSSYLEGETVETIYFGGGTPSLLEPATAAAIINDLRKIFPFSGDPEITFEVNPDDVSEGMPGELKKAGVNRISLGVQSWDDRSLRYLGRRHDAAQSVRALEMIFGEGINNVSVDIIYGVPGTTTVDLKADLEKTLVFPVTHLSAYHLTVEDGTRFGRMKKEGKLKEIDEESSSAMYSLLVRYCREHGFVNYEILKFCEGGVYIKA